MMSRLDIVLHRCEAALRGLEPLWQDGALLTLIVRFPGDPEAGVVITRDDIDELQAELERSRSREDIRVRPEAVPR